MRTCSLAVEMLVNKTNLTQKIVVNNLLMRVNTVDFLLYTLLSLIYNSLENQVWGNSISTITQQNTEVMDFPAQKIAGEIGIILCDIQVKTNKQFYQSTFWGRESKAESFCFWTVKIKKWKTWGKRPYLISADSTISPTCDLCFILMRWWWTAPNDSNELQ